MGFTSYNSKPLSVVPTTQEIVASLTGIQKLAILDGFANNIKAKTLRYKEKIKLSVVEHLYGKIDEIEEMSRRLMRGEVIVVPGDEQNPPVYNTPPVSAAALLSVVQDEFSADFTSAQVSAILTKMVQYSKWDGSGDWAFYSTEVIK
jgi:hypothetical protein